MRILVVDDERLARERLCRLLKEVPNAEVVAEAADGMEALKKIEEHRPEVALLDINMPSPDGLSVATQATVPVVIFTTAHVQFAAEAFDADAVDYLLKPIRAEHLARALSRAERRLQQAATHEDYRLTVHTRTGVRFVDARSVTIFRAADKYTEFECDGEQLLLRDSLDQLEKQLSTAGFARAHRKVLVRRDAIIGLDSSPRGVVLKLSDGSSVEVSRRRAPGLKKLLGKRP